MSYPVTYLPVSAEAAGALRGWHASGDDAAVLARVRELAAGPAESLVLGPSWEPIRRCLVGHHPVNGGEPVFARRDYVINLLDPGEVAAAAQALAGVSRTWLRDRLEQRWPGHDADTGLVWADFARLANLFADASHGQRGMVFFTGSRSWRPPRHEPGPDGQPRVVRPAYRPQDYTVDPNSVRSLPRDGGSWPFEAELAERDGALYDWTEVGRFIRGGRSWVRLTRSDTEYYIDVENAGDRIGRIECVDPLVAYWQARRTDTYPVVLED